MEAQGAITQSGMLYEGNFLAARGRIRLLLELHGLEIFAQEYYATLTDWSRLGDWVRVFDLIKDQINPPLLNRVPRRGRDCPCKPLAESGEALPSFSISRASR